MMRFYFTLVLTLLSIMTYAQLDTLSNNIFQNSDRLGIGINNPEHLLHIQSNEGRFGLHPRQFIFLQNLNNSIHSNVAISLTSGTGEFESNGSFGITSKTYAAAPGLSGFTYVFDKTNGIALRSISENGIIKFITGGNEIENERMRIDSVGNVGISVANPAAKLEVADGDIYISDIDKGIIMKSPDGNCWRGVINNEGSLNFSQINCPGEDLISDVKGEIENISVSIYPNPSSQIINVEMEGKIREYEYRIYSIDGSLKEIGNLKYKRGQIDISSYVNGIYLLEIFDFMGNKKISKKVVKK